MEQFDDALDLAQAHLERETAPRIAAIQRASRGQGAALCIDCGTLIPAARRRHVPNRCAACQEQVERDLRGMPLRA